MAEAKKELLVNPLRLENMPVPSATVVEEVEGAALTATDFDEFVYVLSHDLRASVRALAEIPKWIGEDLTAEGYECSEPVDEYLHLMDTHAHRLDRMLFDLLTYSRIGRKQAIKRVSLSEAFAVAEGECNVPDSFVVEHHFEHDTIVFGVRDVIVMFNALLSNAIKHHHRKEGRFEIRSQRVQDELVITVQDDGPGVPEAQRDRIFKVMTTLQSRDEVEGSGMGLAAVKKIIGFYGGRLQWLDVPSELGTQFAIYFPLNKTTR